MISRIEPSSVSEEMTDPRPILASIHAAFGLVPNPLNVLAHQLPGLAVILEPLHAVQEVLPERLRELASLKAAMLNECSPALQYHQTMAGQVGVTEDQIAAIVAGRELEAEFSDVERLVLLFAGQLTRNAEVDRILIRELRQQLTSQQFVVLALTVSVASMSHRLICTCLTATP
jgi:AhpD family alkylhydroperoxidase